MNISRKDKRKFRNRNQGLSILELVIATAIITVFLTAIVFSFSSLLRLSLANIKNVQASFLTEEGIEAVKFLKFADWNTNLSPLVSDQDYYLNFSGSTWQIVLTPNTGEFERRIVFQDVYRDDQGEIIENGGNLDDETKKLTVYVSWLSGNATTTKSVSTYLSNI